MNAPFLNVTIPAYNEEKALAESVVTVVEFLKAHCGYPHEVVIASNGSTDRTQAIAEELCREYPLVRAVNLPEPGRGRAIKAVWSGSQGDLLSYMDADLSTDLEAFPSLIEPLLAGRFEVATGSRRLKRSVTTRGFKREFISRSYNRLVRALFGTRFSDAQCGFKAMTKKAARELLPLVEDNGWFMDTELLILAERLGFQVYDLPVVWEEDPDSRVKIGKDAVAAVRRLLRLRRNLSQGKYLPRRSIDSMVSCQSVRR